MDIITSWNETCFNVPVNLQSNDASYTTGIEYVFTIHMIFSKCEELLIGYCDSLINC